MLVLTVLGPSVLTALIFSLMLLWDANKRLKTELKQRQEFIDRHLFIVKFPSRLYVFPYIWGTKQEMVLFSFGNSCASNPLFEAIGTDEAKERITKIHQVEMEEMDRLGV